MSKETSGHCVYYTDVYYIMIYCSELGGAESVPVKLSFCMTAQYILTLSFDRFIES